MSDTATRALAMPDLLFLAPLLPAPAGTPAQVRWYHMLRFLSQRYRVHFGGVAGPGCAPAHVARIRAMCYETCFVTPPAFSDRVRTKAWGLNAAVERELSSWSRCMASRFELRAALACSASMASHLATLAGHPIRIADYLDLESHALERLACMRTWPRSRVALHAAGRQRACERDAAGHLDHILFASSAAAKAFGEHVPVHAQRARIVPCGVDADHFSPHILHRSPYPQGRRALLFAGAMDEPANAEAAEWFVGEVFAPLRALGLALEFHVVGARPVPRVLALRATPGVTVTGEVPDLRPYLAHAALVVAPLLQSDGMHTTVLEAMAMQQMVLASPAALGPVPAQPGAEVLQAAAPADWLQAIRSAMTTPALRHIGKAARARVLRECGWDARFAVLGEMLSPAAARHASGA